MATKDERKVKRKEWKQRARVERIIERKIAHRLDEDYLESNKERIHGYRMAISEKMFVSGMEKLWSLFEDKDVVPIYASKHTSWGDIPLFADSIFEREMKVPRIVGGVNINTPLMTPILRYFKGMPDVSKLGMIGIDRDRMENKDRAYILAWSAYLSRFFTTGEGLVFYPEGGRSYSGRIKEINTSIFKSAARNGRHDHKRYIVIPVVPTFEIVPEVDSFENLRKWKEMKNDIQYSWSPMALYLRLRIGLSDMIALHGHYKAGYSRINDAYVDIGEPIDLTGQKDMRIIEKHLENQYLALTRVTPASLVATALERIDPQKRYCPSHDGLVDEVERAIRELEGKANLTDYVQERKGSTIGIIQVVKRGIAGLNSGKEVLLNKYANGYILKSDLDHRIDYYANTIRHFLEQPEVEQHL